MSVYVRDMGVARIFFEGGGTLFKKIFKKFSKNIQKILKKIFKKFCKNLQKISQKIIKNIQKIQTIF